MAEKKTTKKAAKKIATKAPVTEAPKTTKTTNTVADPVKGASYRIRNSGL